MRVLYFRMATSQDPAGHYANPMLNCTRRTVWERQHMSLCAIILWPRTCVRALEKSSNEIQTLLSHCKLAMRLRGEIVCARVRACVRAVVVIRIYVPAVAATTTTSELADVVDGFCWFRTMYANRVHANTIPHT